MSPKKDNRKVMDMLEKMGLFSAEAVDEGTAAVNETQLPPSLPADSPAQAQPESLPEPEPQPQAFVRAYTSESSSVRTGKSFTESMLDKSFWSDDEPLAPEDLGPDADRYLDVDELYQSFRMKGNGVDTVYLIEEYMRTLPESLPAEMRRSIVLKIVSASGFDFDRLLNDGIDRVSKLNEYSSTFAAHTEEVLARLNGEIESLQAQIEAIRQTMNERKNLHKRQFLTIEGEAQRLKEILDFITK